MRKLLLCLLLVVSFNAFANCEDENGEPIAECPEYQEPDVCYDENGELCEVAACFEQLEATVADYQELLRKKERRIRKLNAIIKSLR